MTTSPRCKTGSSGGDARWATIRVTAKRLNTADREHHAPCAVAKIGADRNLRGQVEAADDFARSNHLDPVAHSAPTSALCTKAKASINGVPTSLINSNGAAPVPPSAPSTVINRRAPRFDHGFTDGQKFLALSDTEFEAHRFSVGSFTQNIQKSSNSIGVLKTLCPPGEITSLPSGTSRISEISLVTLAAGKIPPWPGLAPCEILSSIMTTFARRAFLVNFSRSKPPVLGAATEVARADLPNDVRCPFEMEILRRESSFAGVLVKVAALSAAAERPHGIGAQRPVTHGRNI